MCISFIKNAVVFLVFVAFVALVAFELLCALLFWHTFQQWLQYVSKAMGLIPNTAHFLAQVFSRSL